ncbi:alpha/beta hydrolase [Streptomyces bobili]|uniref:alpha/beta hydrolase n=1 Tax=Streptomyces bobili TaxID=67280 RepID=UPI0033E88169
MRCSPGLSTGGSAPCPLPDRLAEDFTVHALELPGTSAGDPYAVRELDELWALVLACEEALRALELTDASAIGHGFGCTRAAEIAACYPAAFARLVLVTPLGLWLDETPVAAWMAGAPTELPRLLSPTPKVRRPAPPPHRRTTPRPPSPPQRRACGRPAASPRSSGRFRTAGWPEGCTGSRHRRCSSERAGPPQPHGLHRGVRPPHRCSIVKTIPGCGHMPQWEQSADTHHTTVGLLS